MRAPHLPGEFTRQIDQVLGQLRLDQENAESHASQKASQSRMIWTGLQAHRQPEQRSDVCPSRCVIAL
jgi:hypothetical protein